MSNCACQLLGRRLQEPAHALHTAAEARIRQIAVEAPRYVAALLYRKASDPVRDALLLQAAARLRGIHQAAERYYPDAEVIPPAVRSQQPGRRPKRVHIIEEENS